MVISSNQEPNRNEFDILLNATLNELNGHAKHSTKSIALLTGNKLEPFVKDVMSNLAVGTVFEGSIELISGQKFPDIIAKKYYGIEVKTTTQNHWKTTGNSVLESSRVDGIERIFMLFAKLAKPIEFRCRPYEECLSEVVVTHSPRYLIDMNLGKGKTIFDKINTPYDVLRLDNPIKPIVDYYKAQLKPGENLWWIDPDNATPSNFIINLWSNLTAAEKLNIKHKAMVFFPELYSNRNDKFARLSLWLVTKESIVCPNVRDLFTAGGKATFSTTQNTYQNVPRILINLFEQIKPIIKIIEKTPLQELNDYWQTSLRDENKVSIWIDLVSHNAKSMNPDVKKVISDLIY